MKVLLHGATNKKNFGDFLYSYIVNDILTKNGYDVYFYEAPYFGINRYYKENLSYNKKNDFLAQLKCDCLVLIPGGYFGEKEKSLFKSLIRYYRYFFIADLFKMLKKPVYIIGVGGAPVYYNFLRKKITKIINYSNIFVVRDEVTKDYYSKLCKNKEIILFPDMALAFKYKFKSNSNSINKTIALHVYGSKKIDEIILNEIVPGINKYNKEFGYKITLIMDNEIEKDNLVERIYNSIEAKEKSIIQYKKPLDLLNNLNCSDIIITTKLHVGVYSSLMNKSVLSFPMHYEKTHRFYDQISESDRCTPLKQANPDLVYEKLKKYTDKKIMIADKIKNDAQKNMDYLLDELKKVEEKNEK